MKRLLTAICSLSVLMSVGSQSIAGPIGFTVNTTLNNCSEL